MVVKTDRLAKLPRAEKFLRFMFRPEIGRLEKENEMLDGYKNFLPFIECSYQQPEAYSTTGCAQDDDSYAQIVRRFRSASTDPRCVDRIDLLPCYSANNELKFNCPRLERFPPCAGLNNIRLKHYTTETFQIRAPAVNIDNCMGQILRPKDFIVQCPVCAVQSYFGWRDPSRNESDEGRRCAREIFTYRQGWPRHAFSCDEEDLHDEPDFCRLHDLVRSKLGLNFQDFGNMEFAEGNDD